MADQTIYSLNFTLDAISDVTIDVSASQSYTSTTGSRPWQMRVLIDGLDNGARGGSAATTDVVSIMTGANQMAVGQHQLQVIWYGHPVISLSGIVLRLLVTKR